MTTAHLQSCSHSRTLNAHFGLRAQNQNKYRRVNHPVDDKWCIASTTGLLSRPSNAVVARLATKRENVNGDMVLAASRPVNFFTPPALRRLGKWLLKTHSMLTLYVLDQDVVAPTALNHALPTL